MKERARWKKIERGREKARKRKRGIFTAKVVNADCKNFQLVIPFSITSITSGI